MPWNGAGTFSRLYSWVADKAAGINITASRMDGDTNDIVSSGLNNCLTRDGQGQATANLPMANFRHTGVGNGIARTDYAALGQVQDSLVGWVIAGGAADAITATYSPAITSLTDGQLAFFRATAANATTAPTFSPNGLTARTITRSGGSALQLGDIPGNLAEAILRYNAANTRWELLNPASSLATANVIPSGTEVYFAGIAAPNGWYMAYGQTVSRTTDASLFAALTITGTGNTHSNTTLNGLSQDFRGLGLEGAIVEGTGINTGTTVVSVDSATSLTLSGAATATATGIAIRFLPYGQGDASTTFNLPDRRGRTIFGRDNMGGTAASRLTKSTTQGINGAQLAGTGGEQAHTMTTGELVTHDHSVFVVDDRVWQGNGGGTIGGANNTATSTVTGIATVISVVSGSIAASSDNSTKNNKTAPSGSSTAFNEVPPGGVSNVIIKR